MADLYTSLVRAKQALNGGTLPPMTPVPENVHHFIDPDLTPGLGALEEDVDLGLRCPVRGCGEWFGRLRRHLNAVHADIGGASAVLRALSIPDTASLDSRQVRRNLKRAARTPSRRDISLANLARVNKLSSESRRKAGRRQSRNKTTVGVRNLRNTCEAQLAHRIIDMSHKVGRTPSYKEAMVLDQQALTAAISTYGTWNAALAAVGLKTRRHPRAPQYDKEQVLTILREYYSQNGVLPSQDDIRHQRRTPLLPAAKTILRAMGTKSWPEAMRLAARALNVKGGRYGPTHELERARRRETLARLGRWVEVHGDLPTQSEAVASANRALVPCRSTILKHLGAGSWQEAMNKAARALSLRGSRYWVDVGGDDRKREEAA